MEYHPEREGCIDSVVPLAHRNTARSCLQKPSLAVAGLGSFLTVGFLNKIYNKGKKNLTKRNPGLVTNTQKASIQEMRGPHSEFDASLGYRMRLWQGVAREMEQSTCCTSKN